MHTSAKAVKRHISYKYAYLPRGVIFAATVRGSAHWPGCGRPRAQCRRFGSEAALVQRRSAGSEEQVMAEVNMVRVKADERRGGSPGATWLWANIAEAGALTAVKFECSPYWSVACVSSKVVPGYPDRRACKRQSTRRRRVRSLIAIPLMPFLSCPRTRASRREALMHPDAPGRKTRECPPQALPISTLSSLSPARAAFAARPLRGAGRPRA